MVMAACTLNRESKKSTGNNINSVTDDVIFRIQKSTTDGKEAHRSKRTFVFRDYSVCGELLYHKLIVGKVCVECVNQPVTVRVGIRIVAILNKDVALCVCIASDVHPLSGHPLAESRGCQERID